MSGLPEIFIRPQAEWVADASPFKICEKGRRTGITWAEAADNVLTAASKDGQNIYYVGTDQEMTEEYIDACAGWARIFNKAASDIEDGFWDEGEEDQMIRTWTIRFPRSQNKILAMSSRPRKLRGRQGILVGDEAAFMDDLPALKKAAMAFLIWGGKVRLISTHLGETNPFNELVQDVRAGRQEGNIHRVTFRKAVDAGLYRRVCLRLGKDWSEADEADWVQSIYKFYGDDAEEELDCIPSPLSGVWLPRNLIEACMADVPIVRWTPPAKDFLDWPVDRAVREVDGFGRSNLDPHLDATDPDAPVYIGVDYGRRNDLTVIWILQERASMALTTTAVVELSNTPFRTQWQFLIRIIGAAKRFAGAAFDATGLGMESAERARQQWGSHRIQEVSLTESWYREHMPKTKAQLEDRTITIPRDRDILEDLRAFKVVNGVARLPAVRTTGGRGEKRHGDAGVALALAVYAVKTSEPGEIFVG